jgi:hypothetical protein
MRWCWESGLSCTTGTRRIDYAAASLRSLVNELLVTRNLNQGGDNRLAYVTFSQSATLRIPFMNDTNQALAAFKTEIGDLAEPRTIPNTDLPGNGNTASAMVQAGLALDEHRTVDHNGNPVGLAVIVLTDDVANVFNDAGYERRTNNYNAPPFYCGEIPQDNQNPLVQWTCPSRNEFPDISPLPLPPMKAAVAAVDANRAANPALEVFAVALGNQFQRTLEDMHLHEVAPNHAFAATAPGMLPGIVATIEADLGDACRDQAAARRPAAGVDVVIRSSTGVVVAQGTTTSDGSFSATLAPGSYTLAAQHLNVIAPADPLQLARNYTVLQPGWNGPSAASVPFVLPDRALTTESANLAIDSPTNATCPQ